MVTSKLTSQKQTFPSLRGALSAPFRQNANKGTFTVEHDQNGRENRQHDDLSGSDSFSIKLYLGLTRNT